MIKSEIQKRVAIEKQFAREADQIQIKVSILEEQMKLRTISDEIIERFLNSFRVNERICKDGKKVIRKGHGEKVYDLIVFYERLVKSLSSEISIFSDFIERLLKLLMNPDLKERLYNIENSALDLSEKRKARFDLIEEQLGARKDAEKIIENHLNEKMYQALNKDPKAPEFLDKGKKNLIKEGFGDKVASLIDYYEQNLAGFKSKAKETKPERIESLLDLILPPEDKTRALNFMKNGDLESAAWVLSTSRKDFHNRAESASKFPANQLTVPKERRSLRSHTNTYRSLTPNKSIRSSLPKEVKEKDSDDFQEKYLKMSDEDLIVFLQCQANGLEELLFNS
jgi:hypothetical protein